VKLARRFNAGNRIGWDSSPVGTVEPCAVAGRFNRPIVTATFVVTVPALKRRAILIVSLRDEYCLSCRRGFG